MNFNMLFLSSILFLIGVTKANPTMDSQIDSNPRSKRFIIWPDSENRLTLPPGTRLVLNPALRLPGARNLPVGYNSNLVVSLPFSINFDDLGLTSEENPWGLWPDFGIFSKRKEDWSPVPGVNWAGGDREIMFQVIEDSLTNIGFAGKQCLLRAICELFETPLQNHGFLAEVMELFFRVSKAPQADNRLSEYLEAENLGKNHKSCVKYYSGCSNSLFSQNGQNKYKQPENHTDHENIEKDQGYTEKNNQKNSVDSDESTWGFTNQNSTNEPISRSKRFMHITSDNRMVLPPGALLVVTPTLQLPVYRNLPVGYGSHMTVSIPFSINFDDLGLTSEKNPWGLWPEFGNFSKKDKDWSPGPSVNFAGVERQDMLLLLEDAISIFGFPGKACLLRTICEIFETPLLNHGFLAEVLELLFTLSTSPQPDKHLVEYLEAENIGKHSKTCSKYYSDCSNSFFKPRRM